MKVLAVVLFALVAVASSKVINIEDVIDLENISAYDYHNKVGIPLAESILKAETERSSRIINGNFASPGQFPYQAGIISDLPFNRGVCGGSLINSRRVLTAAHCWWDGVTLAWRFTVVLGSTNLFFGGERIETSVVLVHHNWNPSLVQNDIAIIRLPHDVAFTSVLAPIALPSGNALNEDFVGTTATASGFGLMFDQGVVSPDLLYTDLSVVANSECLSVYPEIIQSTHMCINTSNVRNICRGDTGGPLVVSRNNQNTLIGVGSFFHPNSCHNLQPSVFTRITSYVTWINGQL